MSRICVATSRGGVGQQLATGCACAFGWLLKRTLISRVVWLIGSQHNQIWSPRWSDWQIDGLTDWANDSRSVCWCVSHASGQRFVSFFCDLVSCLYLGAFSFYFSFFVRACRQLIFHARLARTANSSFAYKFEIVISFLGALIAALPTSARATAAPSSSSQLQLQLQLEEDNESSWELDAYRWPAAAAAAAASRTSGPIASGQWGASHRVQRGSQTRPGQLCTKSQAALTFANWFAWLTFEYHAGATPASILRLVISNWFYVSVAIDLTYYDIIYIIYIYI